MAKTQAENDTSWQYMVSADGKDWSFAGSYGDTVGEVDVISMDEHGRIAFNFSTLNQAKIDCFIKHEDVL